MAETKTPKACGNCGKVSDSNKACAQCKRISYCDILCQKEHWKKHKKVCFAAGAKCTRCLETIDQSNIGQCKIQHPVFMCQDMGSSHGRDGSSWDMECKACGESFTRHSRNSYDYNGKISAPITQGPKYCYVGPHTVKPLKSGDERRISVDILHLTAGPNIQREIDAIPSTMPNVRVLSIQSDGCFDDSLNPTLEVAMPKLEKIKLIDVAFDKVNLNPELTPLVEDVFFQNIPDDCDLTVLLPELKQFSMHYYGPSDDEQWIHDMLRTAKKLESFDSYKLRVGPSLSFASNDLISIDLHRAECLRSLTLYAPKLRELRLQACYGLDGHLRILDSHPDFERPPGQPSSFFVNTTNACVSRSIAQTIESHPRAQQWDEEDEYGSNPMESMFANMRGGGGMFGF
jgi:hypothetical protein